MTNLRCGLIGAGSSATNIAETIASIDNLDLIAISDVNMEMAQKIADKHSVSNVIEDYKDLCKRNDLDFVVISVPHGMHHAYTMYALDQGKHVLIEKPIATRVEDGEEMIKRAKEKNLKLGVHFQNRLSDSVQGAKKIVDSGKIGKILQANVSVMWHRPEDYYKKSNWRGTWELEGGGSIINQGIHTLDQMIFIVGKVKKLFGFWDHKVHDIEVDDITAAAVLFENGAFGTIQSSTATKAAFPATMTVFGTEGAVEIEGNILTIFNADGTSETIDYAAKEGGQVGSSRDPKLFSLKGHSRLMEDFMDAIASDREPFVSGEDGLESLKVVRAIFESNGEKIIEL